MSLWKSGLSLAAVREQQRGSMADFLGIELTELGPDYLRGTMPVDERTRQPFGRLHGGASVVLAEELASIAAYLCIDGEHAASMGQEINANHVRSVQSGRVVGTARPFHIGTRTHVWGVEITDETGRLVCVSRITIAIVERRRS